MPSRIPDPQSEESPDDNFTHNGVTQVTRDLLPDGDSIPSHPLGVKPLGNQYLSNVPSARRSMGSLQGLPDEMLMLVLERLDGSSLQRLASTCKFFYALCESEELWKAVYLQ